MSDRGHHHVRRRELAPVLVLFDLSGELAARLASAAYARQMTSEELLARAVEAMIADSLIPAVVDHWRWQRNAECRIETKVQGNGTDTAARPA